MWVKELLLAVMLALVAAQMSVSVSAFQLMKRDQGPLFTKSFQVRSLDTESYAVMRNDSNKVWLVDFYSPWCPHCRAFAPQWEKVAAFYADSPNVRVGAVDCIQQKDVCNLENVMAYPQVKLYHVPPKAEEPAKMANRGVKNVKNVVSWTEDLLANNDMTSGISAGEIDAQLATLRKDRVSSATTSSKGAKDVFLEDSMETKYKRLRDAGIAAVFTLENGFHAGKNVLEGERYDAAVTWVQALAASFPMEANRNALTVLSDAMKQQSEWSEEDWNKLVKKWKTIAQTISFPKDVFVSSGNDGWALCTTYTCGLWTLFHSMTVSDIKTASPMDPLKPSELMASIRLFVKNFFGCEECQRHFMMANPVEKIHELAVYDAQGPRAVAMWMWLMHNKVNKVLKHGQWPAQKDCPVCYVDDREPISLDPTRLQEDEILSYLSSVYRHEEEDTFSLDAAHNGMIAAMWTSLQGFISLTAGVVLFTLVAVGLKTQSHRFPSFKKMLDRQHAA